MPALTPELAGTGLIASFGVMVVAIGFQIYMLYLNWKQSKVKDTTTELLYEVRQIRFLLEEKLK